MKAKPNPHRGSSLDDFLKAEGIYEEVTAAALRELIEEAEHEAFEAGWNAFLSNHSGLLMAHGIKDFRVGFEEAWTKYWQSRKE
jgi:hypothetical protein